MSAIFCFMVPLYAMISFPEESLVSRTTQGLATFWAGVGHVISLTRETPR